LRTHPVATVYLDRESAALLHPSPTDSSIHIVNMQ
jgi:hypothetical protein